jgi:4-amino-4-deoxy-L-arabinose transferase-like glycosyltransferase
VQENPRQTSIRSVPIYVQTLAKKKHLADPIPRTGIIFGVIRFIRDNKALFVIGALVAFALRLVFIFKFPHVIGDTYIYGDIAKNWIDHGIYGFSQASGAPNPTWIRLPGYPGFLALCFAVFGREHYTAVMLVQMFVDVATCFVVADLARRMMNERAGKIAFVLASICPFTANYVSSPMPETLSVFSLAGAFWCLYYALEELSWKAWIGCGAFIAFGILLRPDGGILLAAVGLFLFLRLFRIPYQRNHTIAAGLIVATVALAPLVPWTIRNWKTFHHFQPLAPRYASDLDEFTPLGYNHWVRTWMAEYVSVEDIYWQMPGADVDVTLLPKRAYDNPEEEDRTKELFEEYQTRTAIGPELDAKFEALARERVARYRFRYYVQLPLMRIADMWFRPRTETLPLDSRWWQDYTDDFWNSAKAAGLGLVNFLYVALAILACFLRPRPRYLFVIAAFLIIRTAFLGSLENPEPRYTLECYPLVIALAGTTLSRLRS